MTRYRWVAARKAEGFPITMAVEVADVSRQAFHDWQQKQAVGPSEAELADGACQRFCVSRRSVVVR